MHNCPGLSKEARELDFRWACEKDLPELINLYSAMTSDEEEQSRRGRYYQKFFNHKYKQNPDNDQGKPHILLALQGEEIVGMRPTMPFMLMVHGEQYKCEWGVDFAVSPSHRSQGIGTALVQEWSNRSPLIAALASARGPCRIYEKLGFWFPPRAKIAVRIIRPQKALIEAEGMQAKIGVIISYLYAIAARLRTRLPGRLAIKQVDTFPAEMDEQLLKMSCGYEFIALRTSNTLNWRFGSQATHNYTCFIATDGEVPVGYVVMRTGYRRLGIDSGVIADILAAADDERSYRYLIRSALQDFIRNTEISTVVCRASHPTLLRALHREGFILLPHEHSLMMYSTTPELNQMLVPSTGKWHLTFGDSDAEFGPS